MREAKMVTFWIIVGLLVFVILQRCSSMTSSTTVRPQTSPTTVRPQTPVTEKQPVIPSCDPGVFYVSDSLPESSHTDLEFNCSPPTRLGPPSTASLFNNKQYAILEVENRNDKVVLHLLHLLGPTHLNYTFDFKVAIPMRDLDDAAKILANVTVLGTVHVTDINDAPRIDVQPARSGVIEGPLSVGEQWRITVTDPDTGRGKNKAWEEIRLTGVALPREFQISKVNTSDYLLVLVRPLDAEDPRWLHSFGEYPELSERPEYPDFGSPEDLLLDRLNDDTLIYQPLVELTLLARDGGGLHSNLTFYIEVVNINDNIPVCRPVNAVTAPFNTSRQTGPSKAILDLTTVCRDGDTCFRYCSLTYRFSGHQKCPLAFDLSTDGPYHAELRPGRVYPPVDVTKCPVTLAVFDDRFATTLSFDVVFAQCAPEVDNSNVTWQAGWPGRYSRVYQCPRGSTGYVYRFCDDTATWHAPVYNCTSEFLRRMTSEAAGFKPNVTQVLVDLANYMNVTNATETGLMVGDVEATTQVMTSLTDFVSFRQEKSSHVQVEGFLEIADTLLEESSKTSWKSIIDKSRSGCDKLLNNIDRFIPSTTFKSNVKSPITRSYVKSNFILKANGQQQCRQAISFPTRDSHTAIPAWAKTTADNIYLPCNKELNDSAYMAVMYKDLRAIIPQQSEVENGTKENTLNSPVISLSLFPKRERLPHDPVIITFQLYDKMASYMPTCSYWKQRNGRGVWDTTGCTLNSYNEESGVVVCKCNHLTNFAILMSQVPTSREHDQALSIISLIGCILSMLFLVLTVATYWYFWRYVGGERAVLLMNLCVALFVAYLVFLAGVKRVENTDACTFVAICLHYVYLVVFFIMLTTGLLLARTVLKPFNKTPMAKWGLLASYGSAFCIVGVSMAATRLHGYGNNNSCWLSISSGLIWAFLGPVLFVVVTNGVIIVVVLKNMYGTAAMAKKTNKDKAVTGVRSVCVLMPVMGITWVFGVFSVSDDTVAFQYLFAIFNSLQGLLIFIFHCVLNEKVRKGYLKKFRRETDTSSTDKKTPTTVTTSNANL